MNASTVTTGGDFVELQLSENTNTGSALEEYYSKSIRIYYRVNRTEIDRSYMGNAETLNVLDRLFDELILEKDDFIAIASSASPEGGYQNNQRLAEGRAISLKNYILQQYPNIKDSQIIILPEAEDWDGLVSMIEQDDNVPSRDALLNILKSNQSNNIKKLKIKNIDSGKPYQYLLKHILPYLRGSATGTVYTKKLPPVVLVDTVFIVRYDTICLEKEEQLPDTICPENPARNFVMAFKTNLIYDAALLPNLSIEIPFGHNYNWSLGIEGNWSWWDTGSKSHQFHRIQIAGAELRRWFGNKTGNPLNGWFLGAYGYGGTYDIRLFAKEKSDEGQLSNWSYSAGLTFGYAMPIAERLNLEFSLGGGYFGGKYYRYTVDACEACVYPWKSTHKRHYFGLTKANISLVWQIGNVPNKKKGKEVWK